MQRHVAVMRTGTAEGRRNELIQVLRFVAAALVVVTHTTLYYHERVSASMDVWHGEVGVKIFFIISGVVMVVSSKSLGTDADGAREFMARRLLRIVPLYWLVTSIKVLIAILAPALVYHNHFDLIYSVKSFLFIPTYNADGDIRPIHGVGWTLLHEMYFYIVFAATMLFGRRPEKWATLFILAAYVFGLVYHPDSALAKVVTSEINLYFIVGMLIGYVLVMQPRNSITMGAAAAGLLVVALMKLIIPSVTTFLPFDPVALLLGSLIVVLSSWNMPRSFRIPVALGNSSYAMYLFHPFIAPAILMLVHKLAEGFGQIEQVILTVAIVIGVSHAIHIIVELPLNNWAKRIFRGRGKRSPPDVEVAR